MGSASRSALTATRGVLDAGQQPELGNELLQVSAKLEGSPALVEALTDPAVDAASKRALVSKVFAQAGQRTHSVLAAAAAERWSNDAEFVAGVEELGVRAAASAETGLADELLSIEKVISGNHELELTIGSKLGSAERKVQLVKSLFAGKVSGTALEIVSHVVAVPRGRRVARVLQDFAKIIADQGGAELATVTVAAPLDATQLERLERLLTAQVGRAVKLTAVIDPSLVGGVRIQIGDNVIDGSVKARLDDLRLQLAR